MEVDLHYNTKTQDECLEMVVHAKNMFVYLPTQKIAYVYQYLACSESTIVLAASMGKNQSLIFLCWQHRIKNVTCVVLNNRMTC